MAFFTLAQSSFHPAIGSQCKLSATNHPDADKYQGRKCRTVAVKLIHSGKPLLTVQFSDGIQVKGLFFNELEDEVAQPLQCRKFENTSSKGIPQFVGSK